MGKPVISENLCKGCGLCVEACPKKILTQDAKINENGYHPAKCTDESACIACAMCARCCPDIAITVYK